MTDIVEITPQVRYSLAERSAAPLSFSKSRFFLVLGLHAQFGSEERLLPLPLCTCSAVAAVLYVVRLTSKQHNWSYNETRFLIELKGRRSPKSRVAAANRIVSAIEGLFTHVHHTVYNDLAPYQIPREMINGAEVSIEMVETLEGLTGDRYQDGIRVRLRSSVNISGSLTAMIFYLLPFVLHTEDLFHACSFFRSCCSHFSFMDGVVREVLDEPKEEPKNETERLALENVILQSFRTIEAIVGEPGNDAKRFHERCRAWGIDANERVGFPGRRKRRLGDRIRWLQDARDSATAHGRRRRSSPFTLFEAMEAQHIADAVLHRAFWWKAQSLGREGDEFEVAFLLEAMDPNYRVWTKDKKLISGKRAVDLARTPGGLTRILRYQERRARAVLD